MKVDAKLIIHCHIDIYITMVRMDSKKSENSNFRHLMDLPSSY